MKKRYSTPEMEVEAFNIFTVFTESSTGGGGIDQGGEEVGDDPGAKGTGGFYANDPTGSYKSKKAGEQSPAFSFAVGWGRCCVETEKIIWGILFVCKSLSLHASSHP